MGGDASSPPGSGVKSLEAMAGHLSDLSRLVDHIEHAFAEERGPDSALDGFVIQQMQKLDFLRQSLEDMSTASRVLSEVLSKGSGDAHAARSLSRHLRLNQSRKLFDQGAERSNEASLSGDLDLF